MKKTLMVTVLMAALTLMTFAGGFNFGPKGELADGASELIQLEKEYQLVSLLNYTGFTKAQLEEIIAVVEDTKADLTKLEEEMAEDLAEAVEIAKTGDSAEAAEKHHEALANKDELVTIKEEFTTSIKSLITVEQQEKMMQYGMQTAMKGMRQGKDFADKMGIGKQNMSMKDMQAIKTQKTETKQERNNQTERPVMENMKDAVMNSERFQQLPTEMKEKIQQFAGNMQKGTEGRNPMQMMQTMKQAAPKMNASTMFFGALLIDDNLEIVKDYAAGLTE